MDWDFSPEEIITGEIRYDMYDFREDLWDDVREDVDRRGFESLFWTLYHLAMGYEPRDMAEKVRLQNDLSTEETRDQLHRFKMIQSMHQNEIAMLKGLIQRQIVEYNQQGVDVFDEKDLAEYIKQWIQDVIRVHSIEE
ncbi:MAG: hypothetical protein GF372_02055 [Candidatus Marinimicrobia bacterium]|nr:hypothetical protein [Candidatus Neomarinimicrobiota bacterium]